MEALLLVIYVLIDDWYSLKDKSYFKESRAENNGFPTAK